MASPKRKPSAKSTNGAASSSRSFIGGGPRAAPFFQALPGLWPHSPATTTRSNRRGLITPRVRLSKSDADLPAHCKCRRRQCILAVYDRIIERGRSCDLFLNRDVSCQWKGDPGPQAL